MSIAPKTVNSLDIHQQSTIPCSISVHVRSRFSHVRFFATPWTVAHQAPPSRGFSRQEYWSGVPLPSPKSGIGMKNNDISFPTSNPILWNQCSPVYHILPHIIMIKTKSILNILRSNLEFLANIDHVLFNHISPVNK